jgi:hypothetical protein
MKKLLLLALALMVVALSGCMENGPSAAEIKKSMADSVANVNQYTFEMNSSQNIEVLNRSANVTNTSVVKILSSSQGAIDLAGREMMVTSLMEIQSDAQSAVPPVSTETYFLNDTVYMRLDNNWTMLKVPDPESIWASQNMAAQQVALLNISQLEVTGSESVDGQDCYKVKVTPDINAYAAVLSEQMGSSMPLAYMNLTELYERGTVDWTSWISKDGSLLKKNDIRMSLAITPETLGLTNESGDFQMNVDLQTQTLFRNYNQPVSIVLPEDARGATALPVISPAVTAETNAA